MTTFPVISDGEKIFAFEIENAYISPSQIAQLLCMVDEVSEVKIRKPFHSDSEIHVRFSFRGISCVVWEPFGDNSRYWIGPENKPYDRIDITEIEHIFRQYRPHLFRKVVGDLLMLRFPLHFYDSLDHK